MDNDIWKAFKVYALIMVLCFAAVALVSIPNRVTDSNSILRFAELAQVPVEQVVMVRHTNNVLPFGDLHDVTYELLIGGKSASGRCSTGWLWTSPLICRLYWGTPVE